MKIISIFENYQDPITQAIVVKMTQAIVVKMTQK